MIILVAGEKGGTGKSTIATNLAAYHTSQKDEKVLLIDADVQGSTASWGYYRKEDDELPDINYSHVTDDLKRSINNKKNRYDTVIIDCGGRDSKMMRTAMLQADIMIVPFGGSQNDLNTARGLDNMLDRIQSLNSKLKCFAVINRVRNHPGLTEGKDAIKFLKRFKHFTTLDFIIHDRISFVRSASQGRGVNEMKNSRGQIADPKAVKEIKNLYEATYGI